MRLNGIRIAGASGIFKGHDYNLGHHERIPYDNSALRSVYHVRAHDVLKLSLLTPGPEIFISHDWPEGIYRYGDTAALLNAKPFFKPDIQKGELGNPHMMDVLKLLRPLWWFAAHLHVRFQAEYDHTGHGVSDWARPKPNRWSAPKKKAPVKNSDEIVMDEDEDEDEPNTAAVAPTSPPPAARNTDEIVMDDEDDVPETKEQPSANPPPTDETHPSKSPVHEEPSNANVTGAPSTTSHLPNTTKFLALDKCVPRRKFLEVIPGLNICDVLTRPSRLSTFPLPRVILLQGLLTILNG